TALPCPWWSRPSPPRPATATAGHDPAIVTRPCCHRATQVTGGVGGPLYPRGMIQLGSVFLPVRDPQAAADWYADVFGLEVASSEAHAAVLETAAPVRRVTLMGPASGIA